MKTGTAAALSRGLAALCFFLATAAVVSFYMSNIWYAALFVGIGLIAGATEFSLGVNPAKVALIRRLSHVCLALGLVTLAFSIGVNFQFHQIILDISRGVVTGALIQFAAARVVLPLLLGNIFCSRACWDGIAFDLAGAARSKTAPVPPAGKGRHWMAWTYLVLSVAVAAAVGYAASDHPLVESKRLRFGFENAAIIFFGLAVLPRMAGRTYCRFLCPFLTVSGVFARFALFKITPDDKVECDGCGACSSACPMGIDVRGETIDGGRLRHPDCLLCEACVASCSKQRLRISPPRSILEPARKSIAATRAFVSCLRGRGFRG